jgi:hypothetical protein
VSGRKQDAVETLRQIASSLNGGNNSCKRSPCTRTPGRRAADDKRQRRVRHAAHDVGLWALRRLAENMAAGFGVGMVYFNVGSLGSDHARWPSWRPKTCCFGCSSPGLTPIYARHMHGEYPYNIVDDSSSRSGWVMNNSHPQYNTGSTVLICYPGLQAKNVMPWQRAWATFWTNKLP